MVVDASAIIAILKGEPEDKAFANVLASDSAPKMSPVNWFEVALKTETYKDTSFAAWQQFAARLGLLIVPVDERQMRLAHLAWRNFGKGRHPARLNMGDCFAYALARSLNEPLLYKGRDFVHTDIASAIP